MGTIGTESAAKNLSNLCCFIPVKNGEASSASFSLQQPFRHVAKTLHIKRKFFDELLDTTEKPRRLNMRVLNVFIYLRA
jgi:hypothetical protein